MPDYIATTGVAYGLRDQGRKLRQAFTESQLEPAIVKLLDDGAWAGWMAGLDNMPDTTGALKEWLQAYEARQRDVAERRLQRLQEQEEAAIVFET
jgi:hypothetical protein